MRKRGETGASADVPYEDASEADAFERAMTDVVRLRPDPRGRIHGAPPIRAPRTSLAPVDPVDEPGRDFAAAGVDRREIRKLKRGDYFIGDQLDLHGMTVADARTRVTAFLEKSRHRGYRCVRIVHGRGLHSDGHTSILKPRVREHLRLQASVLAYADAPPSGGGAGAVDVLLRK